MSSDPLTNIKDAAAYYATLYAPTSQELRSVLPDVADSLHAQIYALSENPTPEGCDRFAITLAGIQTATRKLREAVMRERSAGRQGQPASEAQHLGKDE